MRFLQHLVGAARSFSQGGGVTATPAVTNPQKLAIGQAVVVVLLVLGLDLDASTQQVLIGLSAALGAVLPLSDAVIRHGRASNAPALVAARQAEKAGAPDVTSAPAATPTAPTAPRLSQERAAALAEARVRLAIARRDRDREEPAAS